MLQSHIALVAALLGLAATGCQRGPQKTPPPASVETKSASATPSAATSTAAPPASATEPDVFPAVELACASDDECDSSTTETSCCDGCNRVAGTRAWTARLETYCRRHGTAHSCPDIDCRRDDREVKCIEGRCTLRARP